LHSDFPNGTNCGYVQAAHRSKKRSVHSKHGGNHAFYSMLLLLLKTDPHLRPQASLLLHLILWLGHYLFSEWTMFWFQPTHTKGIST